MSADAVKPRGLGFHPVAGTILICRYPLGMTAPEMIKARPVLVVSPRRRSSKLVTVVPISSKRPEVIEPWHVMLPAGFYPRARGEMWFKPDVIDTFSTDRMDRICTPGPGGTRDYSAPVVPTELFEEVVQGILRALGQRP